MSIATVPLTRKLSRRGILWTREWFWLCAVSLLYLIVAVHAASLRPFWFDELSTLFITSTPTLQGMFHAIPADGNPPLYFLSGRLLLHLPIRTELALRIPSILAYLLTAITIYRFVRRNTGAGCAWLAFGVFLGSSMFEYSIEARAYSYLVCFTGLSLCCWQSYCRSGKGVHLAGMALGVSCAILSHQYGILYALIPLAAGEAVRIHRIHRIDVLVLAAAGAGALTMLLTYPPMLRNQAFLLEAIRACPVFWAHPRLSDLKHYADMLPVFIPALIPLAGLALLVQLALCRTAASSDAPANRVPPEDLAVAVVLLLFLPVMLIVTHFGTNYFMVRYAFGSAMGVAMLSGLLLSELTRYSSRMVLVSWSVTVYSIGVGLAAIWFAAHPSGVRPWNDPFLRNVDSQEPIVVASALEFSPMWWYSNSHMRSRIHYLADLRYAGQHSDLLPEYSLALERQYTPMHMDSYGAFLATHHRFLLYCYGEPQLEWIQRRLIAEGWHLTLLQSGPGPRLADDEVRHPREIFQVDR